MTPKPDPIDQHLENAYAAGRFVESGTISIDAQKALEKFGRFGLAQPGFWVLKIVQAAVACGAPEIDFKFLRKKVVITFENTMAWQARHAKDPQHGKARPTPARQICLHSLRGTQIFVALAPGVLCAGR